LRKGLTSLPDI